MKAGRGLFVTHERIDCAGLSDIIHHMDTPKCDKNGRLFNGHVAPDTRAFLKLLARSMKNVREGKVRPIEEVFADIRKRLVTNNRKNTSSNSIEE